MSFLISLVFVNFLIFLAERFNFGIDVQSGKQKFHSNPTPRTGGIAILISVLFTYWYYETITLSVLMFALFPLFFVGLYEDLVNTVRPTYRLILILISSFILVEISNNSIDSLGLYYLDMLLEVGIFSTIFTVLTIALVVNSFNMVDGFNGLISGLVVLYLIAILLVSQSFGDSTTFNLAIYLCYGIVGFLVYNFPGGRIFLGDLGAYTLGFLVSFILINFVNNNSGISHWFSLTLLIYPIYEVVFSIIRKKLLFKTRAMEPDEFHFHMLVYRNLIDCKWFSKEIYCNSFTAVFIWILNIFPVYIAINFYDDITTLISSSIIFMIVYTLFYKMLFSMKKK